MFKQLKYSEDDSINKITNLFLQVENTEVNKTEEYIEDKYIEDKYIEDEYIEDTYIEDTHNEIHDNIDLDNLENVYVYFSDKSELYETVNKSVSSDGNVIYDVLVYTGEVIDTIEENGELYNIVKFQEDAVFERRMPEWKLFKNQFNAFNEEVTPHIMKDFDFSKHSISLFSI